MDETDPKKINNIIYGYTANINELEEENRVLRETVNQLKNEIERIKSPPLMICDVREAFDNRAVIKIPNGNQFLVEVSSECEKLEPGDSVLVEQKNLTVVKKAGKLKRFNVEKFVIIGKPDVTWKDIGGLEEQMREIKEIIELPLKEPELFRSVGIVPPKGLLLHGPPGTGKTLLAKAVANSTDSTFIEIVGSELVQKFIGEGAKLVKDIFAMAKEKAPAIIFIDELDAIAARRIEIGTSGEREVQRTFMQLLAEIDGFDNLGDVKVIGATNRKDILDPAVIRPGRLERQVHVPLPDMKGKEAIFRIHTKAMSIEKDINVTGLLNIMEGFSGAEIHAVATEAGYFAIRDKRKRIRHNDFSNAVNKVKKMEQEDSEIQLSMFG
ncbi:proteasome-activating nucleotidase [Candidatus Woesearchaeota archaeon]|nr:proteasome-activating nucleotidase [Candidatus Woesearchaeota archaeon]